MQIISPGTHSFRSWKVAEGLSKEAAERLGKLESFEKLRAEGCRPATVLSVLGWPRATCCRWRKRYRRRGHRPCLPHLDGPQVLAERDLHGQDLHRQPRVSDVQ